ncbi:hypothetical protein EJ04DRAFT_453287, partial [Polyplosphaeria fusca]
PQTSQVFVQHEWISLHQQRMLWLPSEYRPTCTAVYGSVVFLGHSSGRTTFLKFHT